MADSCVFIPSVRTPEGDVKESKLFPGILSTVNGDRNRAVDIYSKVRSPQFQVDFGHLPKDENGELKLSSVAITGVFKDITDNGVSKKKMIEYGFSDKDGNINEKIATIENTRDSYEQANKFNQENDDYIAIPKEAINENGDRVITVQVERVTEQNFSVKDKISVELGLHNTLVANLREQGIAVGAMDSLEEHLLDNGVTDFTNLTKTTAEGLVEIIRLGKGERGMAALPEEFSHFVIEACTDNVLVERLVNFVSDDDTIKTILGDKYEVYNKKYKGDNQRLAREAAAKLLAIHLTNVFASRDVNQNQKQQAEKVSSLIDRAWNAAKNIFGKADSKSLEDIVEQSRKLYEQAANKALDKQLSFDIHKAAKEKWFDTATPQSESMERKRKLLMRIIENQTKRHNIAEKRMPESEEESQVGNINISGQATGQTAGYTRRQRELKIRLEEAMAAETYQLGIYDFLSETFKGVNDALTALDQIDSLSDGEEKALRLNRARDFIYSYSGILSDIKEELEGDPDYDSEDFKKALNDVNGALLAITSLKAKYRKVAKSTFEEFVLPYFKDRTDNPFSDEEMRSISEVLESSPKDISIYDLWLRSASSSSNEVIRLLDNIIKRARERGRQKTIEFRKRLEALGMKAKAAGINDFEWMFEKDSDNHKSGNYIQSINYAEYNRKREDKLNELKEKYPDLRDGDQRTLFWSEFRAWEDANTEEDFTGDRIPKYSIYKNTVFESIMNDPSKSAYKEFYQSFTEIKDELDSLLPLGKTEPLGAIKIRKDMLERIMNGGSIVQELKEAVKDKFVKRGDDTDVDYEEAVEDFEGRKVNSLPIYYTRLMPGESADDLSTDVISTMIAYAAMANDYYEMNSILQRMELGRDILLDKEAGHKVGQTKGQKKVEEVLDVLSQKVHKQLTKENTNFEDRLNALYEMSLYSQRRKDEGTVGKSNLDKGKLADELNAITALNTLALNLTAGVTNIVTGTAMLRIEAIAREFMAYKDVLSGDRAYALAMPAFFAEYGNPVKTNKLSLFDEKFNVMQEYEGQIKNTNFDRKNWFQRMFEMDTLFFMNNCGEHWLQNRTALGLAYAYKMKDKDGNETNLWEALEVQPVDKEHPEYGARLVVKEGYTKPDGTEFNDDDVFEFTRKAAAINQRMHGVYNKEDMNVAQRVGLGRMALLFRKYLVPSVDRRFRKEAVYNYDLGTWEQGYYITAFNFLGKLLSDLKEHKLNIALSWKNLNDAQRQNITRALTEVGYFLLIVGALGLLKATDKDRKSRSFFLNEFELQLKRQRAEIGTLTPSPMLLNEALKTLKSPAAGIDTLEDMLGVFGVLNPWNWTKEMQSGRFKGHSRAYKLFMTSPLVPLNNTLYKSTHPEELIPFYNQ